ncbi:LicD family protein [Lachnospiraceae bacterium 56-18]
MRIINIEEKKQLMLDMLVEIDTFCREKDIKYFLAGGTLIGAVRHKGFIPWDDDADIALLRCDYERLVSSFKSKSGNIEIRDFRNNHDYIWPSAKFIHNKTVLIENNNKKSSIGVFIDVFPLDNVYGNKQAVIKYQRKVLLWKNILNVKYIPLSKDRKWYKNGVIAMSRILRLLPNKVILKIIHNLSTKYDNYIGCTYICSFSGAWGKKEISEKELFSNVVECQFENHNFFIPQGYDKFLTNIYGDYMTPPPVEKRMSTHKSIEYWK